MKRLSLAFLIVFFVVCSASFAEIKIGEKFPVTFFKVAPKPQIVVFFTSWSETCQKEIKALSAIYDKLKKRGVEVTAVSLDDDADMLSAYIKKEKVPFAVTHDIELVSPEKYQILVIPTTFIVKKDGTIKQIFVDFDENVMNAIEKEFLSPE